MNELVFAGDLIDRIRASGAPYAERAYLFVLASIEYLQSSLEARRHVSGAELAQACRELALVQFGLMAGTVFQHWGIYNTRDLGRIVFVLVDAGLLVTQPGDRESDFEDVYDFSDAFGASYEWQGMARPAQG